MGLFKNNKKLCPICGEGTPRLLPTQIAGNTAICSDCSAKISMVHKQIKELSVEGLKEHLAKREENIKFLESTFRPNKKMSIGWTSLNIDEGNKLFTIPLNMCGDTKNPPLFKFEELMGYELLEDLYVIERFNKGDMTPLFTPMVYTPVVRFNYSDDKNQTPQTISRSFTLKLYLSHSLWDMVESTGGTASGSELNFQRDYNKRLSELRVITNTLVAMMGLTGGGTNAGRDEQSNVGQVADDLKKFKELLDGGIITQEEFNAKKKQLLDI